MFFLLNRGDRTGSIVQLMMYAVSFCFKHGIVYEGVLTSKPFWWYNREFLDMVEGYFGIKNPMGDISSFKKLEWGDFLKNTKEYVTSDTYYVDFGILEYCNYFTSRVDYYFDSEFKKFIHSSLKTSNLIKGLAVHIRRGDVGKSFKRRYTNDNVYIKLIKNIKNKYNIKKINIFSESNFNGNIQLYKKENYNINLTNNSLKKVFDDIIFFVNSEYLILSKSSFSYLPALLSFNNVYYNNKFWNKPLKNWNIYDDDTGEII